MVFLQSCWYMEGYILIVFPTLRVTMGVTRVTMYREKSSSLGLVNFAVKLVDSIFYLMCK